MKTTWKHPLRKLRPCDWRERIDRIASLPVRIHVASIIWFEFLGQTYAGWRDLLDVYRET